VDEHLAVIRDGPPDRAGGMSGRDVRQARGTDIAAIEAIQHACLREGAWEGVDRADIARSLEDIARDPAGTIVAVEDGIVVGALTTRDNDLAVAPGSRRRGHGRALLDAAVARARRAGEPYVLLYVPGGGEPPRDTAARRFAAATGMRYRATLTRMRRDGLGGLDEPMPPAGMVVRSLARDEDLVPYVAMVNAAFAEHPTYFHLDVETAARAHAAPDFDPGDVAIVAAADDPKTLVAFCRTYAQEDDRGGHVGVIGHVGVLPAWRGQGLGRLLVRWALRRFASAGLERAELSVVAANESALRLYAAEGFRAVVAWPQWTKDVAAGDG
jgi:mycothiol synthase